MKRITLATLALAIMLLAGAWGPLGHYNIASEAENYKRFATEQERQAYKAGSVLPDMALATGRSEQGMFHQQSYLDALWLLADTPLKKAFARGYKGHLEADKIETTYSQSKQALGAPWTADYPVDVLLRGTTTYGFGSYWTPPRISVTSEIKSLIIQAWKLAYPTYSWAPTSSWIDSAVNTFNGYFFAAAYARTNWYSMIGVTPAEAQVWYGDYYWPYNQSVQAVAQVLAAPAPTLTPTPTPTLSPWQQKWYNWLRYGIPWWN